MFSKKILLTLAFLSVASTGYCASYYFDNGGTGAMPCTEADPCDNFKTSTTLDNLGGIACGDHIKFKRGEIWEGSEAEVVIKSGTTSCAGNPIYVEAYGSGINPILAGAPVTTSGWSVHSGSIYKISGQSQVHMYTVTQNDNKAMGNWSGSNTTLPEGTFRLESSDILYVRLWGNLNPATSSVRIANFAHTEDANGARGLLSAGCRSCGATYGHYVRFRDITILGANFEAFTLSGTHSESAELRIIGAGASAWRAYSDLTGSLENSDHFRDFGSVATYASANAAGGNGSSQPFTSYASYGWWVGSKSEYGFMAGFDWLNFGTSTNVTETGCLWCEGHHNGIAQSNPSYDANFYVDGATKVFLYGIKSYAAGVGSGTAGNSREGIKIGSEHPTTDPSQDVFLINSLLYGNHWVAFSTDNASSSVQSIKNITLAYNTLAAYDAGSFDPVMGIGDLDTTTDNFKVFNNIIISDSAYVVAYIGTLPWSYYDSGGNLYYKRGSASTTNIYASGGGAAPFYNLAGWQTAQTEDVGSIYGNPLLTTDADLLMNPTLQAGSPAINAGTVGAYNVPTWLPQTIKDYLGTPGITGSTIAAGTEDNYNSAPDIGYHTSYGKLTSTNVEPASLVTSVVGNVVVSFTIPDPLGWIPYDGKIDVTFPSGFAINAAGTTGVTLGSSISGSATVTVSGQIITVSRSGDGGTEFPGNFSLTLSNIANSSITGSTGTYSIHIRKADDTIITRDIAVPADIIISGAPPTCTDNIQNQGETGVDCGGPCTACAANCSDGIQNGTETGVDCGGTCEACGGGVSSDVSTHFSSGSGILQGATT